MENARAWVSKVRIFKFLIFMKSNSVTAPSCILEYTLSLPNYAHLTCFQACCKLLLSLLKHLDNSFFCDYLCRHAATLVLHVWWPYSHYWFNCLTFFLFFVSRFPTLTKHGVFLAFFLWRYSQSEQKKNLFITIDIWCHKLSRLCHILAPNWECLLSHSAKRGEDTFFSSPKRSSSPCALFWLVDVFGFRCLAAYHNRV